MPFIIPFLAVAGGAALVMWGAEMILNNDDSADEKAAKFLRNLPSHIKRYVTKVEWNSRDGFLITFKTGTPQWVIDETRKNIG
ncbi:MAG: hypothetical protein DWQ02_12145 [Bacteroidetes bacterium]|nr:MAG: hypothetical protein DWQ02_12145 [Bacteroidota bacterium]